MKNVKYRSKYDLQQTSFSRILETNMGLRNTHRQIFEEPFLSRLVSLRRSFLYTDPRMYSTPIEDLKRLKCLDRFKLKLKSSIFREAYDLEAKIIIVDYLLLILLSEKIHLA